MEKKRPSTKPTGFVPAEAKKPPPSDEKANLLTTRLWYIRSCYKQERTRWEAMKEGKPVEYKIPRAYDGRPGVSVEGEHTLVKAAPSQWSLLQKWCDEYGIVPESFIRIAFRALPVSGHAPEPAQLRSQKFLAKWRDLIEELPEELGTALTNEKRIAANEIAVRQRIQGDTYEYACVQTLTASHLAMSPLFRYCLAHNINTKKTRKVAGKLEAQAILQFECYPTLYAKAWAAVLPDGFAERAKELYPYILTRLGAGEPEAE